MLLGDKYQFEISLYYYFSLSVNYQMFDCSDNLNYLTSSTCFRYTYY
jgi:hypothetical protein